MTYIIHPTKNHPTTQLGGKAGALAALRDAGLRIPAWFVLTPAAFYDSLSDAQRDALTVAPLDAEVQSLLDDLELNPTVLARLNEALARLSPNGEPVAVRSSALDEDGPRRSFAGQLESFLCVAPQDVQAKIVAVWRSGFSERVLTYRRAHKLNPVPQAPAVLIQRMVNADVSGVAFSADPITGQRDVALVNAVFGLGVALVSGEVNADTYYVDRQGWIIERNIAVKQIAYGYKNGQGDDCQLPDNRPFPLTSPTIAGAYTPRPVAIPKEQAGQPALTDTQVQTVADLARQTEQFFGCPQDIEWAIEGGRLFLLQSRPITGLPPPSNADGLLNIWDNSNIAESYPGVTTPLTFSFARRAYEEVYRQFCYLMAVPAETIESNANTFRCMLGLMQGRIYYNLLNWYRVLAMLPGYKINRRFMEQMMGVKESLPNELLNEQTTATRNARLKDGLRLLRTVVGLVVNFFLLPRRIDRFKQRLQNALGQGRPDLSGLRADELAAYYRNLEQQLLTRWDAPLVNDFFAMIFYGLLSRLTKKWCSDPNGTLQNELLTNTGGIISAEPVAHIDRMAHLARADPTLVTMLCEGSLPEILAYLPQQSEFETQYQTYLDKFGDRCLEELKLESSTLYDNPLILLRAVGQLARQARTQDDSTANKMPQEPPMSGRTHSVTLDQLPPIRRFMINWVLKNARILIRNRENLRFERTRLFGRARMIFVELGRRFHALDKLADPGDIFYLEVEEALGFVDGAATTTDLKGLVAVRKAEFERYHSMAPPPGRFETRGIPYAGFEWRTLNAAFQANPLSAHPKTQTSQSETLQGLGCCPGVVRGSVRVVINPKTTTLYPGEILVAERTDPGWILLFPAAAGLLVEHGSLLSHAAIVSREMGLPAIVSLKGVTHWLKDGDWVEFDGSTGLVTKISK